MKKSKKKRNNLNKTKNNIKIKNHTITILRKWKKVKNKKMFSNEKEYRNKEKCPKVVKKKMQWRKGEIERKKVYIIFKNETFSILYKNENNKKN